LEETFTIQIMITIIQDVTIG